MLKQLTLFIFIATIEFSPAEPFFHSDFEPIKTVTLLPLKKGAVKILPAPSDYAVPDSGLGVIEPGAPENKEIFKYVRKRNYLVLKSPLKNSHNEHVEIILGGLQEWDQVVSNQVKTDTNSLEGNFSVNIPIKYDHGAMIQKKMNIKNDAWYHLAVKFSKELFPGLFADTVYLDFLKIAPGYVSIQITTNKERHGH
ncbi:MAG: hypothetical protein ABIA63_10055, partial [bacterium]